MFGRNLDAGIKCRVTQTASMFDYEIDMIDKNDEAMLFYGGIELLVRWKGGWPTRLTLQ